MIPFVIYKKRISEKQSIRLLRKGSTVNLKGFKTESGTVEGLLRFDEQFKLVLEPKINLSKNSPDIILCPKCNHGKVIKGKSAYGCSDFKSGCEFRFSFDAIKEKAKGKVLSKALVYNIINGKK